MGNWAVGIVEKFTAILVTYHSGITAGGITLVTDSRER